MSHYSLRGAEAKSISSALGIEEPSNVPDTAYEVEIDSYEFYTQISAQTRQSRIEVDIFEDKSVGVLKVDMGAGKANRTMFDSSDSSVTTLTAVWSLKDKGVFQKTGSTPDQKELVNSKWHEYDAILKEAKQLASSQALLQSGYC